MIVFPMLHRIRQHQIGNSKSAQAGFRLRATTRCAFITNFTAGPSRSASKWRDRGRVIMRFDLHQNMGQFLRRFIHVAVRGATRIETRNGRAFDHRRVIAIRNHGTARRQFMRILDHGKQGFILLHAVDGPIGVKYFMAAVFAVCLRKHHQLDVSRITLSGGESCQQIVDFIIRQSQA